MPSRALESVRKMIYVLLDRTGTGVVVVLDVVDVTSRSEVVEDDEEMRIFYLIAICFAQRRKIPFKSGGIEGEKFHFQSDGVGSSIIPLFL